MEERLLPQDHGIHIQEVFQKLQKERYFQAAAEVCKQLGDPTRLQQAACVTELSELLDMSSPAISHHLRSLEECGLLVSSRQGKEVLYRAMDTEGCRLLHKTLEQLMEIACPEHAPDTQASPEEVVHIVHEHLLDHLDARTTIRELSQQFLINPTTLKETFKQVYGTSIAAHMNEHRMEKAAHLLTTSYDSIEQIAHQVGYESQSRFSAVFKQAYGLTPSAYRRQRSQK